MSEIIRQLYGKSWSGYEEKVRGVVATKSDAELLVKELISNKGWRERVSAAKIIVIYNLTNYIPELIETFVRAPEYYTCVAFTTMIQKIYGENGIKYLSRMNNSCSNDERGKAMKNIISKKLNEYKKA